MPCWRGEKRHFFPNDYHFIKFPSILLKMDSWSLNLICILKDLNLVSPMTLTGCALHGSASSSKLLFLKQKDLFFLHKTNINKLHASINKLGELNWTWIKNCEYILFISLIVGASFWRFLESFIINTF